MVVGPVFLNPLLHITNVNVAIHIDLPTARKRQHVDPTPAKMEELVSKAQTPRAPPSGVPALVVTLGSFVKLRQMTVMKEMGSPTEGKSV